MLRYFTLCFFINIITSLSFAQVDTTYFGITVDTRIPGSTDSLSMQIPTSIFAGSYNYNVDWNDDGIYDTIGVTGNIIHRYSTAGVKRIRIKGTFPSIYFNNARDKDKLISIDQWGTGTWSYLTYAFAGCGNMVYNATDYPILANNTSLYGMFYRASSMHGDLSNWDVSQVSDFRYMFHLATLFNGNVTSWNMSNATSLEGMFHNAASFNQNLGSWDVSSVTDLTKTFSFAFSFTGDSLGNWDVSNVQSMRQTFETATAFNGDISSWDVSSVNIMDGSFQGASSFNQDISNWNVSNVNNMRSLFFGASNFNQNIGAWDISSVTDMTNIFSVRSIPGIQAEGLSVQNYDSILISWQAKPHQLNVPFGAATLQYCLGDFARNLLIADGWIISGDSLNCQLVGIEELYTTQPKVYPNPSTGVVTIEFAGESQELRVYNTSGRLVYQTEKHQGQLDLSFLSKGLYLLMIDGVAAKLNIID